MSAYPLRNQALAIAWQLARLASRLCFPLILRDQSHNLLNESARSWHSLFLIGIPQHRCDPAPGFEVCHGAQLRLGLFLSRRLGQEFLLHGVDGGDHGALGRAVALDGKRELAAHHGLNGGKARDLVALPHRDEPVGLLQRQRPRGRAALWARDPPRGLPDTPLRNRVCTGGLPYPTSYGRGLSPSWLLVERSFIAGAPVRAAPPRPRSFARSPRASRPGR